LIAGIHRPFCTHSLKSFHLVVDPEKCLEFVERAREIHVDFEAWCLAWTEVVVLIGLHFIEHDLRLLALQSTNTLQVDHHGGRRRRESREARDSQEARMLVLLYSEMDAIEANTRNSSSN